MNLPLPRTRNAESHKGDYGRTLIVGGSLGMSGAAAMAGKACLRSGAGLVTIATAEPSIQAVAAYEPSYMTRALPADAQGRIHQSSLEPIEDLLFASDCVAVGPGLGRSLSLGSFVSQLYQRVGVPLVVDADAINMLAKHPAAIDSPGGTRVFTPHPGEFRRLADVSLDDREGLEQKARQWAADHRAIVVLKGHRSFITDGERGHRNETGNPGMATGGSGDVLTGVIAGLISQGYSPWDASVLGCHLHGLAGDFAAKRLGEISMIASDIVEALPEAYMQWVAR